MLRRVLKKRMKTEKEGQARLDRCDELAAANRLVLKKGQAVL